MKCLAFKFWEEPFADAAFSSTRLVSSEDTEFWPQLYVPKPNCEHLEAEACRRWSGITTAQLSSVTGTSSLESLVLNNWKFEAADGTSLTESLAKVYEVEPQLYVPKLKGEHSDAEARRKWSGITTAQLCSDTGTLSLESLMLNCWKSEAADGTSIVDSLAKVFERFALDKCELLPAPENT